MSPDRPPRSLDIATDSWTTCLLEGGLPVVTRQRRGPEILAARLAIRGGSGDDPPGHRGVHQLLAGLMTRGCGTLDADALADRVEGAGAALRAEAHEDGLMIALKCASADAAELLPLLLLMVRQPILDPDQFELERSLNLQTLHRQQEDPFQLAHDQLRCLLYGSGPYGHDPLGCEADLEATGRDDLPPLVERLGSQGAVLVLCGELPAHPFDLLDPSHQLPPWRTGPPAPAAEPVAPSPDPGGGRRIGRLDQTTEQLVMLLGAATVPLGHPDSLPLRLLQAHLGLGMSSRLFVTMREEHGLAYDVGVHFPARCGASPFVMHLSTSAERSTDAVACLLDEWQRILETPLEEEERRLALAKFLGQDAMGRQTGSQIAERQALVLSHGLPGDHVEQQLIRARRIGSGEILAAARRWLAVPCLSLVGPSSALAAAEAVWNRHSLSHPLPPG